MYGNSARQLKEKIIGKTITAALLSDENTTLTLMTDTGKHLVFHADGDCCSESWIEHMTEPKYPAKILDIVDADLGECDGTRQECDKMYSTTFKTDQGNLEVEYRNSSNGYYGGALCFVE